MRCLPQGACKQEPDPGGQQTSCRHLPAWLQADAAHQGVYDRVLLDAPCSGTGVLAKRADLRWRLAPSSTAELAALQVGRRDESLQSVPDTLRPYSDGSFVRARMHWGTHCDLKPDDSSVIILVHCLVLCAECHAEELLQSDAVSSCICMHDDHASSCAVQPAGCQLVVATWCLLHPPHQACNAGEAPSCSGTAGQARRPVGVLNMQYRAAGEPAAGR